jgi:uncharacterized protein (DUF305 family)
MALPNRSSRNRVFTLCLLALVVLLAGSTVFLYLRQASTPGEDSAEAGFLRDMQVHHTQAVVMAMIIRDRTDDDQIKAMATDIAFSQTSQMGMMQGFLNIWDLNPTGDDLPMTWMGHPTEGLMPGMATNEEIDLLRTLPVHDAETLFLQLMNRHHIAGVEMAQAILDTTSNADVEQLATAMVRTQDAEIQIMNQLLTARGAETVTPDNAYTIQLPTGSPVASPAATPSSDHAGH